ncbi:MAG: hypothetical protein KBG84_15975, partial [Planctomycetes bacterium]|nr:hypothetical protein [Planctomycetota bacterium]
MNTQEARYLFAAALNDSLNLPQRTAFEQALKSDAKLRAEFEAYADAQAGDVANVTAWLTHSGEASRRGASPVDAHVVDELVARVYSRRRTSRIVQFTLAGTGIAVAAALVAVLFFPPSTTTPQANTEGVSTALAQADKQGQRIYSDGTHFAATTTRGESKDGSVIELSAGCVYRMEKGALVVLDGVARLKLAQGALRVRAGSAEIRADAPAEFTVKAQATTLSDNFEESLVDYDKLQRPRRLARFGAASLTLTVSVLAGSVTVSAQGAEKTLKVGESYGPTLLQAQPQPPKPQPGQPR